MVLTTGATSPTFTPFNTTFIGPACPLSAGKTSPTFSSSTLEEEISDPSAIPSALVIFLQPHILPITMETPTFEQVQETALVLVQGGSTAGTVGFKSKHYIGGPEYCFMMVNQDSSSLSIQDPSLPEVSSPSMKEDINDLPITPTVLNLASGPCLVAYPLGTPDLDQIISVALRLAQKRSHP
ncbi:hypothetical protein DSO57_1021135 [Entomophthora muscae]|uniref:Uncharacterized protein n=1 Tax=Entomophthora muscae TaxID=34485 RepID=A0ACC2S5H8_9FUNG|nr:hypothetical protein DSO57_1021135 [Entomophthora muscae]